MNNEIEKQQQKLLVKSNKSAFTKFSRVIGKTHLKIIYSAMAQIKKDDDLDIIEYKVSLKTLMEDIGSKSKGQYDYLIKVAEEIQEHSSIRIDNLKGGFSKFNLVREIRHPYKYCPFILIQFDSKIKQHFGLDTEFNKMVYGLMMGFKSYYSMRFYEIFNAFAFKKELPLSVDYIKEVFDLQDKYQGNFTVFFKAVIQSSIDEINEKSNLFVTVEKLPKGKKRVTDFVFYINKVRPLEAVVDNFEIVEDTLEDILKREGIKEQGLLQEFLTYEKDFVEYTIGRVREEDEIKPKKSFRAFLIGALRGNYYKNDFEVLKLKERQKSSELDVKKKKEEELHLIEKIKTAWIDARNRLMKDLLKDAKKEHREEYIQHLGETGGIFAETYLTEFKEGKRENEFATFLSYKFAGPEANDICIFAKKHFNITLIKHLGNLMIAQEKPVSAESS